MNTYQFTLVVRGVDFVDDDAAADALFEAGGDDSSPGWAHGVQYVDFDREAGDALSAILSAIETVERSVRGAHVVRVVDAGLVSISEMAGLIGRTKGSIQQLVNGDRGPGGFPAPVNSPTHRYRLWRTDEAIRWFVLHIDPALSEPEEWRAARIVNAALALRETVPGEGQRILQTIS